jgi:hypothetical protein
VEENPPSDSESEAISFPDLDEKETMAKVIVQRKRDCKELSKLLEAQDIDTECPICREDLRVSSHLCCPT